jgi:hypothetical protein
MSQPVPFSADDETAWEAEQERMREETRDREEALLQEARALAAWDRTHRGPQDDLADEQERDIVRARDDDTPPGEATP